MGKGRRWPTKRVFFPLSSSQSCSRKQEAGNGKLTEAREIWLSILIWLGSCSIGGEKGGPGEGGFGGGWRQAEGFVKIVMATFGDFRLFPAKACPLRHAERRAFFVPLLRCYCFFLGLFAASGSMGPSFVLFFCCCVHWIFLLSSLIFELLHPATVLKSAGAVS
jgi:hypothetical protein